MKKLLILPLSTILLSSCGDSFNDVTKALEAEPQSSEEVSEYVQPSTVEFPFETTLTDAKGRAIKAKILGKEGNQISIARIPSGQRFVLALSRLSIADRSRFTRIEDGGLFHSGSQASKQYTARFPIRTKLTDLKGRSIDAMILGKKGNQISIKAMATEKQCILALNKLSEANRLQLLEIADGGTFDINQTANLANRNAVWHWSIDAALKESSKLGIPMLLAVSNGTDKQTASDFEKALVYSSKFKQWANQNVTLCLIRVENGSRENTFENWQDLAAYGIPQSGKSAIALINPDTNTSQAFKISNAPSTATAINALDDALSAESSWTTIVAAPEPVRKESPFKVNGGPIIGSSSGSSGGGGGCRTG